MRKRSSNGSSSRKWQDAMLCVESNVRSYTGESSKGECYESGKLPNSAKLPCSKCLQGSAAFARIFKPQ